MMTGLGIVKNSLNPQPNPSTKTRNSSVIQRPVWLREVCEDAGGAHASSDAHGHESVAGVPAFEFTNDRGGQLCAGAAQGVPERNRSAVGIDLGGIESGFLNNGKRLRGKRFVELDDVDG